MHTVNDSIREDIHTVKDSFYTGGLAFKDSIREDISQGFYKERYSQGFYMGIYIMKDPIWEDIYSEGFYTGGYRVKDNIREYSQGFYSGGYTDKDSIKKGYTYRQGLFKGGYTVRVSFLEDIQSEILYGRIHSKGFCTGI